MGWDSAIEAVKNAGFPIAGHKFDAHDGEFQLLLNSHNNHDVRRHAMDLVNEMNGQSKESSFSLTSILDNKSQILAISGVNQENLNHVMNTVMNRMSEKGYAAYSPSSLPRNGGDLALA